MIILTRDVRVGQHVTEIDTPSGPWYEVVSMTKRVMVIRTLDDDPIEAKIPVFAGARVLVREDAP